MIGLTLMLVSAVLWVIGKIFPHTEVIHCAERIFYIGCLLFLAGVAFAIIITVISQI